MTCINEIANYLTIAGEDDKHPDLFHAGIIDLKVILYTGNERKIIDMGKGFQVLTNHKKVLNPLNDSPIIADVSWTKLWGIAGFILESMAEENEETKEITVTNRFWFNPVTLGVIQWEIAHEMGHLKCSDPFLAELKRLIGGNAFQTGTTLTQDPVVNLTPAGIGMRVYAINNIQRMVCNTYPTVAIIIAPESVLMANVRDIPLETILLNTIAGTIFDYKFTRDCPKPNISFISNKDAVLARDIMEKSATANFKTIINYDSECIYNSEFVCRMAYLDDNHSADARRNCFNDDFFQDRNQLLLCPKSSEGLFYLYMTKIYDNITLRSQHKDFVKYDFILRHIMHFWERGPFIFDLVEAVFNQAGCDFAKYHTESKKHDLHVVEGYKECRYIPRLIIRTRHGGVDIILSLEIIFYTDMEE